MTTRCKMKCTATGQSVWNQQEMVHSATFAPVYSNDPESENSKFFKATPNGSLTLGVVKEQHFEVNKEYYIDITEA